MWLTAGRIARGVKTSPGPRHSRRSRIRSVNTVLYFALEQEDVDSAGYRNKSTKSLYD